MNRSILIVICDFLLVSLLVFSTVDINEVAEEGRARPMTAIVATNQADGGRDLTAVMKLALEDEQKRREQLAGELARTRETASEREKQVHSFEQQLQTTEQRLQTAEQQRAGLQEQFAAAQTNIATLSQQVRASSTDATITKEKLAAMEAELRKRAEDAAALQKQLSQLSQSNQLVLNEKQQLATQLQVAEVEKRHAAEQVVAMKEQVKVEREEKAKLVEGVKALATNSTQLVQEIRENRPLAPNTIFEDFAANRVKASFNAFRSGLFDTNKRKETGTVLVTDGTNTFALCHVEDTPLTLWTPGTKWEGLTGALTRGTTDVPIRALSFHLQDPRIVFAPVSPAEASKLGSKVYRISETPFKFQDAVLVGATESYYGECRFEIDVSTSAYVKLDRNVVKGWFGKFNPSRGDLVFSRTGELLGIMANNTYCLLIHDFNAMATFNFGPDVRAQDTGSTLAALYSVVQQMPLKLQ
jgi:hypothetical protein